jgi:hypothetical protein
MPTPDTPAAPKAGGTLPLISNWKEAAAAARDTLLLLVTGLLILFPRQFNDILVRAGFEEGSLVGFTWKKQLVNSDAMLSEANSTITELKAQNAQLTAKLQELKSQVGSGEAKAAIDKLTAQSKALEASSDKVVSNVAITQKSYAELVNRAVTSSNEPARWAVVFGGDVSLPLAAHEVTLARDRLGIANGAVYLRQGSYRSVAMADSWAQAQTLTAKARTRRADAYVVNLDKWCPNVAARDGYQECVGGT